MSYDEKPLTIDETRQWVGAVTALLEDEPTPPPTPEPARPTGRDWVRAAVVTGGDPRDPGGLGGLLVGVPGRHPRAFGVVLAVMGVATVVLTLR